MRVRVTKPEGGKTTIRVDDRRGETGFFEVLENVDADKVKEALTPVLTKWETKKAAIKAAKRAPSG